MKNSTCSIGSSGGTSTMYFPLESAPRVSRVIEKFDSNGKIIERVTEYDKQSYPYYPYWYSNGHYVINCCTSAADGRG